MFRGAKALSNLNILYIHKYVQLYIWTRMDKTICGGWFAHKNAPNLLDLI